MSKTHFREWKIYVVYYKLSHVQLVCVNIQLGSENRYSKFRRTGMWLFELYRVVHTSRDWYFHRGRNQWYIKLLNHPQDVWLTDFTYLDKILIERDRNNVNKLRLLSDSYITNLCNLIISNGCLEDSLT